MNFKQVYDLPTRFFHWTFVALFVGAFLIAKQVDDETALFSFHMMMGLTLGFVVLLRILWGFVGTSYARFSTFELRPSQLILYFRGLLQKDGKRWFGHNPASSWSGTLMMALALGLGATGLLMAQGGETLKESVEEIHELLAYSFLAVSILHVAGVLFHMIRFREPLAFAMVDGKKTEVAGEHPIESTRPWIAWLFLILVLGFSWNLLRGFDPKDRSLNLFGWALTLGEEGHDHDSHRQRDNQDDKEDEDHEHEDHEHEDHGQEDEGELPDDD